MATMQREGTVDIISISSGSSSMPSLLVALNEQNAMYETRCRTRLSMSRTDTDKLACRFENSLSNSLYPGSPTYKVTNWLQKNFGEIIEPKRRLSIGSQLLRSPPGDCSPIFINRNLESPTAVANRTPKNIIDDFPPESVNRSSILVRQDYKKQPEICNNNGVNHMQTKSVTRIDSLNGKSNISTQDRTVVVQRNSVSEQTFQTVNGQNNYQCPSKQTKTIKQKSNFDSVPLSPETQKKFELCEYLKLMNMNPVEGKEFVYRKHRRSTRVKHLALMSEKRELEKKLNTGNLDTEKKRSPKRCESRQSVISNITRVTRQSSASLRGNDKRKSSKSLLKDSITPQNNEEILKSKLFFAFRTITVPNSPVDFDECIQNVFSMEIKNKIRKANMNLKDKKNGTNNLKSQKGHGDKINRKLLVAKKESANRKKNIMERLLRKKKRHKEKQVSITKMKKQQKKQKKPSFLQNLIRLRSRGRLRAMSLDTILLKQERTNMFKRKIKPTKRNPPKPTSQNTTEEKIEETQIAIDDKISEPDIPMRKTLQLELEQNLLNNLTPEHKQALSECRKYLNTENKSAQEEVNNKETEINKQECRNYEAPAITKPAENVSNTASVAISSQESSEDAEVGRLMCKQANGEITQQASPSWTGQRSRTKTTTPAEPSLQSFSYSHSSCSKPEAEQTSSSSTSKPETTPISSNSLHTSTKFYVSKENGFSATSSPQLSNSTQPEIVNISDIERNQCNYIELLSTNESETKSLHQCLTQQKRKQNSPLTTARPTWDDNIGSVRTVKNKVIQSHTIHISGKNGSIVNAYYLNYNLVIVQEFVISFWYQTPLGNVLGAQDMWISKGSTQRSILGNGCVHKRSSEMVISIENFIAYVELWTKEHKSDKRERPVADIFVTVYLRTNRSGPDKKVLQLENINGYPDDVQYIVLRNSRVIIVSWNVSDGNNTSSTVIHCYQLSLDFQIVTSIKEIQSVDHYVSSLHNIDDCDTLIMGCGESKITLWNIEYCYVVATIDLVSIHPQPRTLTAKCDRGFLFTLHQFDDGLLQLIAINSFDSTWKKLQTYKSDIDSKNLLGACMENGLVVAFYDVGISCWTARTGELVYEDLYEGPTLLPYGNHVVIVINSQVYVRHTLEYLVTTDDL